MCSNVALPPRTIHLPPPTLLPSQQHPKHVAPYQHDEHELHDREQQDLPGGRRGVPPLVASKEADGAEAVGLAW